MTKPAPLALVQVLLLTVLAAALLPQLPAAVGDMAQAPLPPPPSRSSPQPPPVPQSTGARSGNHNRSRTAPAPAGGWRLAYHVVAAGPGAWQHYDWSKLTAVAQFGGWDAALAARAEAAGVLRLSEFGWACLPTQPCGWISNRTAVAGKAEAAVALAHARGADGINVDVEGAGPPHCTAEDLTHLVQVGAGTCGGHAGWMLRRLRGAPSQACRP